MQLFCVVQDAKLLGLEAKGSRGANENNSRQSTETAFGTLKAALERRDIEGTATRKPIPVTGSVQNEALINSKGKSIIRKLTAEPQEEKKRNERMLLFTSTSFIISGWRRCSKAT
jgi:hypothetical protein